MELSHQQQLKRTQNERNISFTELSGGFLMKPLYLRRMSTFLSDK